MTRILIVDDRPENLLALAAVLESVPAEIVTASSGEEALRRMLEGDYAVVLLDVQMPGMDGFEVAEYAKRLERTRYTPIIFLTARDADAENVARGYETGAVDFVVKPYEPAILRSKVAVFVELHEKTVALEASERRFKTAFEDAPIGVGLLGLDGRWVAVNRALCEIAGRPAHGLVSSDWRDLLDPSEGDTLPLPDDERGARSAECRFRRADGGSRAVLVSTSAVRDADGAVLHHLVMANDVTAHREAEAKAAAMAAQAMVHEAERNAQAEIAAAHRTLLQTLLPTIRPGIPVRAFYRPGDARLLLGGDFYDCLVDGDGRLRMMLGDVSGHGPAAAGLGAALRVAWRALAEAGTDDAELPAGLERVLEAERPDPDMFATICCATLDPESRLLRFVSAGHPAPLILADEPRAVPIEAAPPLGVLPLSRWPVHEIELQPDEGVLLYTDGLIEGRVEVGSQERFGVDRLLELVGERRLAASPEELESVIREIARVGGGLPDDVAALILLPATKARRKRSADAARAARGD
jgi:PAS domain S-box-containing protein